MTIVVADSGPLIHLSRVGLFDILPALYGQIVVPRAVFDEVVVQGVGLPGSAEVAGATWAEVVDHDSRDPLFRSLLEILQIGESAAIVIALARQADLLLVDDSRARMAAMRVGLRIKGTLGLLVLAKQQGHIDAVAPYIATLQKNSVWISNAIIHRILQEAGEDTP